MSIGPMEEAECALAAACAIDLGQVLAASEHAAERFHGTGQGDCALVAGVE